MRTLQAVVDYLEAEPPPLGSFVQIVGPGELRVLGNLKGESQQRFCYLKAVAPRLQPSLGVPLSPANAVILLQTAFQETPRREELLRIIGALKDEESRTSHDDGVSQVVGVKAGVHNADELAVKNPFVLRPFRTFPEIDPQPDVPYVVRFERGPAVSLHEQFSDWTTDAAESIRAWLKLAGVQVPIIA